MKLRCITNSIRLRLRKSDVKFLADNDRIRDWINFPNGVPFEFGIDVNHGNPSASFEDNCLLVTIPKNQIDQWIHTDEVSLAIELPTLDNGRLKILIEKDFPCKHTGDDFDDTYHELQPEEFKMHRQPKINTN